MAKKDRDEGLAGLGLDLTKPLPVPESIPAARGAAGGEPREVVSSHLRLPEVVVEALDRITSELGLEKRSQLIRIVLGRFAVVGPAMLDFPDTGSALVRIMSGVDRLEKRLLDEKTLLMIELGQAILDGVQRDASGNVQRSSEGKIGVVFSQNLRELLEKALCT